MIDSKILNLKPYELSSKDISYNLIYKQLGSNSPLITVIKSRESCVSQKLVKWINICSLFSFSSNLCKTKVVIFTNKTVGLLKSCKIQNHPSKRARIFPNYYMGKNFELLNTKLYLSTTFEGNQSKYGTNTPVSVKFKKSTLKRIQSGRQDRCTLRRGPSSGCHTVNRFNLMRDSQRRWLAMFNPLFFQERLIGLCEDSNGST